MATIRSVSKALTAAMCSATMPVSSVVMAGSSSVSGSAGLSAGQIHFAGAPGGRVKTRFAP